MPRLGEDLEDRARHALVALDWLIGIGVRTDRDGFADVARARKLSSQQVARIDLVEQLGLEIDAGGQAKIGVRRSRVAVDAPVLASAIGIDRVVERNVGRLVRLDDAAGEIRLQRRGDRVGWILREPAVTHRFDGPTFKASGGVRERSPSRQPRFHFAVPVHRDTVYPYSPGCNIGKTKPRSALVAGNSPLSR